MQNTTGSRANRVKLASTKKGIENFISGSLIEIRPMSVDKLQGLRCKVATVDEWLSSADAREDVIGAVEQGASKLDDYLIIATSSEGTVRNGARRYHQNGADEHSPRHWPSAGACFHLVVQAGLC